MNEQPRTIRRKRKLIKSGLQLRLVLAFATVATVACFFQVTLLNRSLWRLARELPIGGDEVVAAMPGLLAENLLWTFLFLLPATLLVGIVVTHRVAGPIYRFETYLSQLVQGEASGPCRIRKDDELQELCERINEAVEALGGTEAAGDRSGDGTERDAA